MLIIIYLSYNYCANIFEANKYFEFLNQSFANNYPAVKYEKNRLQFYS